MLYQNALMLGRRVESLKEKHPNSSIVRLRVPAAAVEIFEAALQALGGAVARDAGGGCAEVTLEVYLREEPDRADLTVALDVAAAAAGVAPPPFVLEALPALDWVAESQKGLPPLRIGRFFVYAPHAEGERPASAIAIRIEAGRAFGTGHHESTRGCLLALDTLSQRDRPRASLDLGCGSGILAIAMAKLWRATVLACDIDPLAVAVTRANARLNGVAPLVRAVQGDGAARRSLMKQGAYDVMTANILAGPLAAMAGELRRALAPGGRLVLSGLLRGQVRAVLARYRARHLRLESRLVLGDWATLVLRG
jgi:ribosomal protein L11 methyltransferase